MNKAIFRSSSEVYKNLLFSFFLCCISTTITFSQCPFPFAGFGSNPAPTPGNSTVLETCNFPDEYVTATGVVSGEQYSVSYSGGSGDFITIYDNTFTAVASGFSPISFTATYNGTYYSSSFIGAVCGNDFTCNASLWSNITPLPPPPNDLPCGAITLVAGATCSYSTFTNDNATASPGVPIPGCAGYLGGDVWFTTTIPASGNLLIDSQIDEVLDGGMAIYTGTCGALTLVDCDDDDSPNGAMPSVLINSLAVGTQVFIRMWEVGNNNNGSFGICAVQIGTCGTPLTLDYCEGPQPITQGPGDFSSSTSAIYTPDIPGNLATTFCGSIENNTWYQFTALNTTETFDFISITGCVSNMGIQAAVYEITQDINGCCDILSLVSNCYSPSTTALGTVTATSLTVGGTYVLMVDGFSGDACDFTVSNWVFTATPLPVDLSNFYGFSLKERNILKWETASESNNDYFSILRSYDGVNFEAIGQVYGVGNSTTLSYYQFDDLNVRTGVVYYQLNQIDFNGENELSEIIVIDRKITKQGLINLYPNPTINKIVIEINEIGSNIKGTISITDLNGTLITSNEVYTSGFIKYELDMKNYHSGVFFLRYKSENYSKTIKLIKQ